MKSNHSATKRIVVLNEAAAGPEERDFVLHVEDHFAHEGTTIYRSRNQIKKVRDLNVKRYGLPNIVNRYLYDRLRLSKAERAYRNALRLTELGVPTALPFGYVLHKKRGALLESYLVTAHLPLTRTMYEFGHVTRKEDASEVLRAFALFTATLHEKGVLHLDYSPGNILFDRKEDGSYAFAIVDVNRLLFSDKPIPIREGLRNMRRLWGERDELALIARSYATARGADEGEAERTLLEAHAAFWGKRDTRWIHELPAEEDKA